MAEYSRLASGSILSTGGQTVVPLPFIPNFIEITNTSEITANNGGVTRAWWETDMGQGAAAYVITDSSVDNSMFISASTGGGFSTIQAGLALQYGPAFYLGGSGGIAKTSSTVLTITTTAAHGLVPGDWVVFQNLYETTTTGMQQIAGIPFEVLTTNAPTNTTFTIGWVGNSTNLTAISAGGLNTNASFKQILYPALYVPGVAVPWSITVSGGVGTVKTTAPHNFQVGQEIAFRIPSAYGAQQLNELPNNVIPGSPQYYYVASVTRDGFTFSNAPASITTFNVNQTFASFPGLKFPQVVATGDVNSGGYPYSGGTLYPSPSIYNGQSQVLTPTINGPAIQGAYINATFQGFVIGATIAGSSMDQIYWRAYMHDLNT
jgi:hypothetical protein